MKHPFSDFFVGMLFLGLGSLIVILNAIIAFQTQSNFIEVDLLFRGSIIGLVLLIGGLILVNISKLQKGLQSTADGSKK